MQTESYIVTQEHQDVASELARLKAQVDLSWAEEARQLELGGLQDGMRVLEMGCGPGFVLEALYEKWPLIHLTGLDVDGMLLKEAQQRLGQRVALVEGHAEATHLPDNSFDFVIARYLFQHVADPVTVAQEALRVLKPNGKLVIIDVDDMVWGLSMPTFPQLSTIFAKASRAQARRGGDRFMGRKLWRILKQAGFASPRLDLFSYHSDELGLEPFLAQMHPDRLLVAVRNKMVSWEEYWTAVSLYRRFLNTPDAFVMMVGFIAIGEKTEC